MGLIIPSKIKGEKPRTVGAIQRPKAAEPVKPPEEEKPSFWKAEIAEPAGSALSRLGGELMKIREKATETLEGKGPFAREVGEAVGKFAEFVAPAYEKIGVTPQLLEKIGIDPKRVELAAGGYISGVSGGILKPETTAPEDIGDKVAKTLGEVAGVVGTLMTIGGGITKIGMSVPRLTAFISKHPRIWRYLAGIGAFTTYGQIDPDLGTDAGARMRTFGQDVVTGALFTRLGGIRNVAKSVPAAFGLGFGLSKISGGSNEDAIISGGVLAALDLAMRAGGRGIHFTRGKDADKILTEEARKVLGIKKNQEFTTQDLRKTRNRLSVKYHPDKPGGDTKKMAAINNAYDVLKVEAKESTKQKIEPIPEEIEIVGEMPRAEVPAKPKALPEAFREIVVPPKEKPAVPEAKPPVAKPPAAPVFKPTLLKTPTGKWVFRGTIPEELSGRTFETLDAALAEGREFGVAVPKPEVEPGEMTAAEIKAEMRRIAPDVERFGFAGAIEKLPERLKARMETLRVALTQKPVEVEGAKEIKPTVPEVKPIAEELKPLAEFARKHETSAGFRAEIHEAVESKDKTPEQQRLVDLIIRLNSSPETIYPKPAIENFWEAATAEKPEVKPAEPEAVDVTEEVIRALEAEPVPAEKPTPEARPAPPREITIETLTEAGVERPMAEQFIREAKEYDTYEDFAKKSGVMTFLPDYDHRMINEAFGSTRGLWEAIRRPAGPPKAPEAPEAGEVLEEVPELTAKAERALGVEKPKPVAEELIAKMEEAVKPTMYKSLKEAREKLKGEGHISIYEQPLTQEGYVVYKIFKGEPIPAELNYLAVEMSQQGVLEQVEPGKGTPVDMTGMFFLTAEEAAKSQIRHYRFDPEFMDMETVKEQFPGFDGYKDVKDWEKLQSGPGVQTSLEKGDIVKSREVPATKFITRGKNKGQTVQVPGVGIVEDVFDYGQALITTEKGIQQVDFYGLGGALEYKGLEDVEKGIIDRLKEIRLKPVEKVLKPEVKPPKEGFIPELNMVLSDAAGYRWQIIDIEKEGWGMTFGYKIKNLDTGEIRTIPGPEIRESFTPIIGKEAKEFYTEVETARLRAEAKLEAAKKIEPPTPALDLEAGNKVEVYNEAGKFIRIGEVLEKGKDFVLVKDDVTGLPIRHNFNFEFRKITEKPSVKPPAKLPPETEKARNAWLDFKKQEQELAERGSTARKEGRMDEFYRTIEELNKLEPKITEAFKKYDRLKAGIAEPVPPEVKPSAKPIPKEVFKIKEIDENAKKLLEQAKGRFGPEFDPEETVKTAGRISILNEHSKIQIDDMAEALSYKGSLRNWLKELYEDRLPEITTAEEFERQITKSEYLDRGAEVFTAPHLKKVLTPLAREYLTRYKTATASQVRKMQEAYVNKTLRALKEGIPEPKPEEKIAQPAGKPKEEEYITEEVELTSRGRRVLGKPAKPKTVKGKAVPKEKLGERIFRDFFKPITGKKTGIEILEGVAIDGKQIMATDLNKALVYESDIDTGVKAVIPISELIGGKGVRPLKPEDITNDLVSRVGKSIQDFPELPKIEPKVTTSFSLPPEILKKALSSVAEGGYRPEIAGIFFKTTPKGLLIVSTDSFKLWQNTLPGKPQKEFSFIIPEDSAKLLTKILDKVRPEEINIKTDNKQIEVAFGKFRFLSRLVEGNFPDYKPILPGGAQAVSFETDRLEFLDIVREAKPYVSSRTNELRLIPDKKKGTLKIRAERKTDEGKTEVFEKEIPAEIKENVSPPAKEEDLFLVMPIKSEEEAMETGQAVFNRSFLEDFLKNAESEKTKGMINKAIEPAIFQEVKEPAGTKLIKDLGKIVYMPKIREKPPLIAGIPAVEARKYKSAEEFVKKQQTSFEWWKFWQNKMAIKKRGDQQILLKRSPILSPEDVVAEFRGKPRLEEDAPIIPITRYEADNLQNLYVEPSKGVGLTAVGRFSILPEGQQTGLEGYFLYDLPIKQPLKYGPKFQTIPTPKKKAVDLFDSIRADRANRIFKEEKSIQEGLSDFELQIDRSQLTDFYNQVVRGVKAERKPAEYKAIRELPFGRKASFVTLRLKDKGYFYARDENVQGPDDVADMFRELKNVDREKFFVVNLNKNNKIINIENLYTGTINASLVHPQEVVKSITLSKAKKVYLVHNHPSGDAEPSEDDLLISRRIENVIKGMGVEPQGHIVMNTAEYGYMYPTTVSSKDTKGWEKKPMPPEVKERIKIKMVEVEQKIKDLPEKFDKTISNDLEAVDIASLILNKEVPSILAVNLNARNKINGVNVIGLSIRNPEKVADKIIKNATLNNAVSVILVTNLDILDTSTAGEKNVASFQAIEDKLGEKGAGISLLDVVGTKPQVSLKRRNNIGIDRAEPRIKGKAKFYRLLGEKGVEYEALDVGEKEVIDILERGEKIPKRLAGAVDKLKGRGYFKKKGEEEKPGEKFVKYLGKGFVTPEVVRKIQSVIEEKGISQHAKSVIKKGFTGARGVKDWQLTQFQADQLYTELLELTPDSAGKIRRLLDQETREAMKDFIPPNLLERKGITRGDVELAAGEEDINYLLSLFRPVRKVLTSGEITPDQSKVGERIYDMVSETQENKNIDHRNWHRKYIELYKEAAKEDKNVDINVFGYIEQNEIVGYLEEGVPIKTQKLAEFLKEFYANSVPVMKPLALRTDYITHTPRTFMEKVRSKGLIRALKDVVVPNIAPQENISPDLEVALDYIVSKEKFNPFALPREEYAKYSKQLNKTVNAYASLYFYKKHFDPVIPQVLKMKSFLPPNKQKYVRKWLQTIGGRPMDYWMWRGKPMRAGRRAINVAVRFEYATLLGLNVSSGLGNAAGGNWNNIADIPADRLALGNKRLFTKQGRKIIDKYGLAEQTLYLEPVGGRMENLTKAERILFVFMQMGEYQMRGSAALSVVPENEFQAGELSSETRSKIRRQTARTQGLFGPAQAPLITQTTIGRPFAMFKHWMINEMELWHSFVRESAKRIKERPDLYKNPVKNPGMRRILKYVMVGIVFATLSPAFFKKEVWQKMGIPVSLLKTAFDRADAPLIQDVIFAAAWLDHFVRGEVEESKDEFVRWFKRISPEAKKALESAMGETRTTRGTLIRKMSLAERFKHLLFGRYTEEGQRSQELDEMIDEIWPTEFHYKYSFITGTSRQVKTKYQAVKEKIISEIERKKYRNIGQVKEDRALSEQIRDYNKKAVEQLDKWVEGVEKFHEVKITDKNYDSKKKRVTIQPDDVGRWMEAKIKKETVPAALRR